MTSPSSRLSAPRRAFPASQRGLSLLGLIVLGVILVFGALVTLKVFPTVTEYLAIKRAIVKARADGTDPQTIRNAFDRAAAIDDITSITGKDLRIARGAREPAARVPRRGLAGGRHEVRTLGQGAPGSAA